MFIVGNIANSNKCNLALTMLIVLCSFIVRGNENPEVEKMRLVLKKHQPFHSENAELDDFFGQFYQACQLNLPTEIDSLFPLLVEKKDELITPVDSAIFYFNLGFYWVRKGDMVTSQKFHSKAGIIFERENQPLAGLYVRLQMANIQYFTKGVEEAFSVFESILADPARDEMIEATMHHNIGTLLMEIDRENYYSDDPAVRKKSIGRIEYHLDKAIEMFRQLGYSKGYAATYSVYVNIKIYQGQFDQAQAMIDSCQQVSIRSNDRGRIAFLQIKKAMLLDTLGNYDAAIDTAYLAANYYESVGNWDQVEHALGTIYRSYYRKGDYKSAAEVSTQIRWNMRTNFDQKLSDGLAKYRTEFDTEKKELELNEKNAMLKTEQLKSSNRNRMLLALGAGTIAIVALLFLLIQRNKRKAQKEKDALVIKNREEGLKAILQAQESERKRIAEDLHDGIVQQLGGLKLGLQKTLDDSNDPGAKKMLQVLEDSTQELRALSHQMMPRSLGELGLVPALEDMLEIALEHSELEYSFEHFGVQGRTAENIEITIYRIAQELVNNVIKHSQASFVSIQLINTQNDLVLIVEDNGRGIQGKTKQSGIGLLNIASRLNTVNGEVNYEPSPESGTLVTVKIPLTTNG